MQWLGLWSQIAQVKTPLLWVLVTEGRCKLLDILWFHIISLIKLLMILWEYRPPRAIVRIIWDNTYKFLRIVPYRQLDLQKSYSLLILCNNLITWSIALSTCHKWEKSKLRKFNNLMRHTISGRFGIQIQFQLTIHLMFNLSL